MSVRHFPLNVIVTGLFLLFFAKNFLKYFNYQGHKSYFIKNFCVVQKLMLFSTQI